MSPSSVCTLTRTGPCASGLALATIAATTATAAIVATGRATRISIVCIGIASLRWSEAIDRPELELPARVGAARRLAEVDVAEDADVAVRRVVLVVEQIEDVGANLHAVPARQRKRAGEREIGVAHRRAARRIAALRRRHVAGALGRAEHLSRAG